MIVADVHNHTNASHGKASVGEMYAAAKDRGLAVYGFSEHSPRPEAYSYPVEYREHLRQNFVCYASEVMQLRALSGSPKVLLGMELDWFPSERPFMEAAVAAYPFDFIIGGIHFLGSWGFDFTQDDWKISPQQCYTRYENYFRTLADMARSGLVDIAAHPDIIKLYSVDVFHQWLAMPESLALISVALVIAVLLVFNWNHTVLPIRILGIAFIVLQFAVIPLGARRAQAKTCRKAIRDAEKRGEYPARVEFLFQEDHIRTTVGKEATSVRYREVSHLAALKDWRFLYFGQGAYIIPVSAFRDAAELDRFDTFITGKCGMPIVILEGEVPKS